MRCFRRIKYSLFLCTLYVVLCTSCDGTSFQSSVPRARVNMVVDTNTGQYVHFKPTALGQYITLDQNGYHYNDYNAPRTVTDMYGYGGVVLYINLFGGYDAYDLACPNCAEHGRCQPCTVDGMFAVCPHCGEQYDLGSGTAAPQKGIAHEYLLRLPVTNSGGRITVRQ